MPAPLSRLLAHLHASLRPIPLSPFPALLVVALLAIALKLGRMW